MRAPASEPGTWHGLVATKRNPMMSDHVDLTRAQALVLSLVFNAADWATSGARRTRIDPTGRHRVATIVAQDLVARGLLKARDYGSEHGAYWRWRLETRYRITRLGVRVVRSLILRGHDEEWLKANQKPTKAERFQKQWVALERHESVRGGA